MTIKEDTITSLITNLSAITPSVDKNDKTGEAESTKDNINSLITNLSATIKPPDENSKTGETGSATFLAPSTSGSMDTYDEEGICYTEMYDEGVNEQSENTKRKHLTVIENTPYVSPYVKSSLTDHQTKCKGHFCMQISQINRDSKEKPSCAFITNKFCAGTSNSVQINDHNKEYKIDETVNNRIKFDINLNDGSPEIGEVKTRFPYISHEIFPVKSARVKEERPSGSAHYIKSFKVVPSGYDSIIKSGQKNNITNSSSEVFPYVKSAIADEQPNHANDVSPYVKSVLADHHLNNENYYSDNIRSSSNASPYITFPSQLSVYTKDTIV